MIEKGLLARARQCLLAGVLGDAWGSAYEGRKAPFDPTFPEHPRLSNHTLLTLATCESILENKGQVGPVWMAARFLAGLEGGRLVGLDPAMLKAPDYRWTRAEWASPEARSEFAAGAGAATRAAPLAFFLDAQDSFDCEALRDISRLTHRTDDAHAGALAVVTALQWCQEDELTADGGLLGWVADEQPTDIAFYHRVNELCDFNGTPAEVADRFGSSGWAGDVVPLAIFVAEKTMDHPLTEVLRTAVSLGGDTGAIATIAGQIAAASGREVPEALFAKIEGATEARAIIERFAALFD